MTKISVSDHSNSEISVLERHFTILDIHGNSKYTINWEEK